MNLTIDLILKKIVPAIKSDPDLISNKDKRILLSLSNQLDQGHFLTENQSKLLTKIFSENIKAIETVEPEALTVIKENLWSQVFRIIQRVRKISFGEEPKNTILVEFTYDKRLKEKLVTLNAKIDGTITAVGSKSYAMVLTEKNVHTVVSTFVKDDFDIDEKIMNFYLEIDKILRDEKNVFNISVTDNENFKKIVERNVGPVDENNFILLHDRKIRHQYDFFEKIEVKTLADKIATRKHSKIFVSSTMVDLDQLLLSLQQLNRLPAMIVFEGHDAKINKKSLDLLNSALTKSGVIGPVGIYFRFDSKEDTVGFNSTISALSYNQVLDEKTQIAGIANNKLPKFMVKNRWKPETVISFTTNFKNNKSAVYCNDVDLIVYYTDKRPLNGEIDVIV